MERVLYKIDHIVDIYYSNILIPVYLHIKL